MHITPEFAGLIAQVFPALLIALLVEGRVSPVSREVRWTLLLIYCVRYIAIVGATMSTFYCLFVAGSRAESESLDWIVSISGLFMFLSMSFMNGTVMGSEQSGVMSLFKKQSQESEPQLTR